MAAQDPPRRRGRRHQRQGQRQDRQGPARGPQEAAVYVEGLNIVKRHQRPTVPAPAPSRRRRHREGRPDPHLQRHAHRSQGQQADARRRRPRGRHAQPRGAALRDEARLIDMATTQPARLKARYNEEIRPALIERFGYSTLDAGAASIEKVTLNMGVGEAKQDSKMLEAAQRAAREDRRPEAERPPRAQVDRRSSSCARACPSASAVTLRGERAYEFLDRLMSIAIPRIRDFRGLKPDVVRRPRQLPHGRPRADHLPRDRLRRGRPGPRPRRHDHDVGARPTRRPTRCSRRSACRSRREDRNPLRDRPTRPRRPDMAKTSQRVRQARASQVQDP